MWRVKFVCSFPRKFLILRSLNCAFSVEWKIQLREAMLVYIFKQVTSRTNDNKRTRKLDRFFLSIWNKTCAILRKFCSNAILKTDFSKNCDILKSSFFEKLIFTQLRNSRPFAQPRYQCHVHKNSQLFYHEPIESIYAITSCSLRTDFNLVLSLNGLLDQALLTICCLHFPHIHVFCDIIPSSFIWTP